MIRSERQIFKFAIVMITVVFLGSSCGRLASREGLGLDQSLFSRGDSSLIPATDKMAQDCAARAEFDACIFLKNPVAQVGGAVLEQDLTGRQHFGVKIRDLGSNGFLENNRVQILTLNTPRFSLINTQSFKHPYSPTASYTEQIMAYYWVSRVFSYLESRVGPDRLPLTKLKIYVDDVFTGFSARGFSISLEKASGKIPKALSADVMIQLTGQALASSLSDNKVFDSQNLAQHKNCGYSNKGCCSTAAGCANALTSAFGDYLSGIMFPNQPLVGETIAGVTYGQLICGEARNLETLRSRTQNAIYSACNGHVALEGAWYASLWWNLRKQAELAHTGDSQDIDALFFDHARAWTASFTFVDAKAEALSLAATFKAGKYLTLMQSALAPIN